MNSIGVLPVGYLDASKSDIMTSLLANAEQIHKQFILKEEEKRNSEIRFKRFEPLRNYDTRIKTINLLIQREDYANAEKELKELISTTLSGIEYYHT